MADAGSSRAMPRPRQATSPGAVGATSCVGHVQEHVQLTAVLVVTAGPGGAARADAVVSGELDIDTISTLRAATRALAAAAHARSGQPIPLVLNLKGVTFLDSSGLQLLDELHREGVELGWALRVIPPTALVPCHLLRFAASQGWVPRDLVRHARVPAQRTRRHPLTPAAQGRRMRGEPGDGR